MAAPRIPDLVGLAEVQKIVGANSRQSAHYTSRKPDFPRPVQTLAMGSIWLRSDVEKWEKERER